MAITPDTKDWTVVLERPCEQCGFDPAEVDLDKTGGILRANAEQWRVLLQRDDARSRPDETTWSPTEYACHVRDVIRVFDGRLERILREDEPHFDNWDQDKTAIEDRYAEQSPAAVAEQLVTDAARMSARLDTVQADQWDRHGYRSDGVWLTAASVARLLQHELRHHLQDASRR